MTHAMTLSNGSDSLDLYSWLHRSPEGMEALAGITGFGLPPVANRWFEGSGDGAGWRGVRVLPRVIDLPIIAEGHDREALLAMLSKMARILDARYRGPARLDFMLPDNELWSMMVVRDDGGDWVRGIDSDNSGYVKTVVTLKAGDPYWARLRPERFEIGQSNDAIVGLMPYLARLRVTPTGVLGSREVNNTGDAPAWPIWTISGPFEDFTLTSSDGQSLTWDYTLTEAGLPFNFGEGLVIDTKNGTVRTLTGANAYDGLGLAPKFWSIAPRTSQISVEINGISPDSHVLCEWQPRRWLVV